MSVRYIGSKVRIAEAIVDLADPAPGGRFVDAFCGTGAVAAAAADRGWSVIINDALPSAVAMSTGALVGRADVPFLALGGYEAACHELHALEESPGYITAEYSPASARTAEVERRYFTESNAARIDSIRAKIGEWSASGQLTIHEERLLLSDLMQAANRVANISGTYGCFLADWAPGALKPLALRPRALPDRQTDFDGYVGDVFGLATTSDDVVYFDPPYTKRQYAAYYHLLETICAGDSPDVVGVTGLRPWKEKASDFSYKTRALDALTRLVMTTDARSILLSYSNEGHVPQEQLLAGLTEAGHVTLHEISTIGRYRPNAGAARAGGSVSEYVIEIVPVRASAEPDSEPREVAHA